LQPQPFILGQTFGLVEFKDMNGCVMRLHFMPKDQPSDLSFAIFLPQQSMNDAHGEVDESWKTLKLQCTCKGDKSRACVALSVFGSEMVFQNITLPGYFKSFQLFGIE